jgi:hypothetical protein
MKARKQQSLYSPDAVPKDFEPGVFDDTLDAHPPYHLYQGEPTPEELAAADAKAAELGLLSAAPAPRLKQPHTTTRPATATAFHRKRTK